MNDVGLSRYMLLFVCRRRLLSKAVGGVLKKDGSLLAGGIGWRRLLLDE
jgi:hypothetical protein